MKTIEFYCTMCDHTFSINVKGEFEDQVRAMCFRHGRGKIVDMKRRTGEEDGREAED